MIYFQTTNSEEALAPNLLSKKIPDKWVRPRLPEYKELIDHEDHVHKFITNMENLMSRKDVWCTMFFLSLEGEAIGW